MSVCPIFSWQFLPSNSAYSNPVWSVSIFQEYSLNINYFSWKAASFSEFWNFLTFNIWFPKIFCFYWNLLTLNLVIFIVRSLLSSTHFYISTCEIYKFWMCFQKYAYYPVIYFSPTRIKLDLSFMRWNLMFLIHFFIRRSFSVTQQCLWLFIFLF